MHDINLLGVNLQLLPEKAVFIKELNMLLVADIHLGKAETFQAAGIPIANAVNQATLHRLQTLCSTVQPQQLMILGDLFHSRLALVSEVLEPWNQFLRTSNVAVQLIVGNHDRPLVKASGNHSISCSTTPIQLGNIRFSHEPEPPTSSLNICGHVHPCVRLRTKLDDLRLPCFFHDRQLNQLTLPSFGDFTGGYEVRLTHHSTAYVIVENAVIPLSR
ncbi:ligase-associated DNA damage response endonuclease PdeM [Oculatella sp. LEGE 06141]|uniref:ligase-associated DNA damage response endonuclease PdeM n=1 Tax=Oculatella sp. LEGE 06141 TaxID=1828648 RepID=UPI00187DE855|nr:ligase-associated DNA damage response endonuclease PdeM [Oculatella sp. LEGE 06141]MBE9182829.1 ligase-associated DNA damage response endonuclease PdeM [Oculatella sp. LEGE 06141]